MDEKPTTADPRVKPRRRWYQYGLRTLLIFVTLAGCGLGWLGVKVQQARRQQAAVAALERLGANVVYDYEHDALFNNPDHHLPHATPPGPRWMRAVLGDDFFRDVWHVDFSSLTLNSLGLATSRVTDAGLANLAGLTSLEKLDLGYTQVTDAGVKQLQGMTRLKSLALNATHVTDAGLVHLKGMTQLEALWLDETPVTDAGLEELVGLTQLRVLCLHDARVTDAGAAEFQKAIPNCSIIR